MLKSFSSKKIALLLACFILLSDQISKQFIAAHFCVGDVSPVCSFFNISRVANKGISFGLLSDTVQPIALIIMSMLVVIALALWTRKNEEYLIPSSMIISGAIGNIIDRVTHAAVIDFLDFHIGSLHWPAFNIADSAIVIGVCVLFFVSYGKEES